MAFFDFLKPKRRRRGKLQPKSNTHSSNLNTKLNDLNIGAALSDGINDKDNKIQFEKATGTGIFSSIEHAASTEGHNTKKEFLKVFNQLTHNYRAWDIWRDFIIMFACALSNPVDKTHYDEREARYLKTINKYDKDEQKLFPELLAQTVMALEENQDQDLLGELFMELDLGDSGKQQIFTPYYICHLMATTTMGDVAERVKNNGYITINDPCCGAGATLIAASQEARRQLEKVGLNFQNHILISAQDIDEVVALMCYIQLSLLGVAAYVKVGSSLTEPMCSDDSEENYWFTMMYFSDVWTMRRLFSGENL